MFNKFKGWILLPLLLVSGGAFAEAAGGLNVAVIDTQRALLESEEAKQLMQAAQADLQADQTQVQTLGQQIQALQEQFKKDAEVMSEADRRTRQKEIEDKQMEYQFLGNKLQKAVNDRRQELGQQMVPKLEAVLKDLTAQEKYDFVLERGALVYADPKYDVTKRVTELLNAKKGASGG